MDFLLYVCWTLHTQRLEYDGSNSQHHIASKSHKGILSTTTETDFMYSFIIGKTSNRGGRYSDSIIFSKLEIQKVHVFRKIYGSNKPIS